MRGMEGAIEKHSEILGTQANYTKVSRVAKLPKYLLVKFNRFDSKTIVGGSDDGQVKGLKILKPISFPQVSSIWHP